MSEVGVEEGREAGQQGGSYRLGGSGWLRQAFLQGRVWLKTGEYAAAKEAFSQLVGRYPELGDYVLFYLGMCRNRLGEYAAAKEIWQQLLEEYPESRWAGEARRGLAEAAYALGEYYQASRLFRELVDECGDSAEAAELWFKLGRCLEKLGQKKAAARIFRRIFRDYPAEEYALEAQERLRQLRRRLGKEWEGFSLEDRWLRIGRLVQAGRYKTALEELEKYAAGFEKRYGPRVLLLRARCYLGLRKRYLGIRCLERLVRKYPGHTLAASARYRLGRLYWNCGQDGKAVERLLEVVRKHGRSSLVDDAYYILGRIYEENGEYAAARRYYLRLVGLKRASSWRDFSLWRLGWLSFRLGEYAEAGRYFEQVAERGGGRLSASAKYWEGRAKEKEAALEARKAYMEVLRRHPWGYYAWAAEMRMQGEVFPRVWSGQVDLPPAEVVSFAGLPHEAVFHLERVQELAALFLYSLALAELDLVAEALPNTPRYWLWLSRVYRALGGYYQSVKLALRLVSHYAPQQMALPWEVLKLAYPLNYWGYVREAAERYGLDPYLVLAVIHRESLFDRLSRSPAGALGLMQLLPSTGRLMAKKLGWRDFSGRDLFEPQVNIDLGCRYLAELLRRFRGNLVLALAAYNAGEQAVRSWLKRKDSRDIFQFVEDIPYPETREYIKWVLSNYDNYLRIYTGRRGRL